ncbi:MAG: hypothetical protein AAF938_26760, partial [Myxococcota bacterium]
AAAIAQGGPTTIDVRDIRPGMRGFGLSVFRGEQPERFDVEVIDVLHGFRPDQDLILVRTPHPLLDHARAVGGMSGSPVYLNGKLAGAYAYGWQFGLDPVVGVTPIANMLAEIDRPVRPLPFGRPFTREQRSRRRAQRNATPARAEGPTPVVTPVMFSGFDPSVVHALSESFAEHGLVPLQGGGAGQGAGGGRFVDGGAIGVTLVRGDISATAIGTVTHVGAGSRVVAFGHPMLNGGEVRLPTSTARVLHVLASAARSFKIAEAIDPLGSLVHDRQAAIVVDSALQADTVPVRIRLHGLVDPPRSEWNLELASHRQLTPQLLFGSLLNAIKASSSDEADVMFRAEYEAEIEGHAPVRLTDEGYMGAGPSDARALSRMRLFDLVEIAYANAFEPSRLRSVNIDLHLRFGDDVLRLVDASAPQGQVDPGARVPVRLRFRRYGEADLERTVLVPIPMRAAGETVRVRFRSGASVRRETGRPTSMADLVVATRSRFASTQLIASMRLGSRGVRFEGQAADSLPRGVMNTLRLTTEPAAPSYITELHTPYEMNAVVSGDSTLSFRVRQTPLEDRR